MPVDTRRNPAPDGTVSPLELAPRQKEGDGKALVDATGQRADGRGSSDIRPMYMQVGVVHGASGSSYVELGGTKVICSVFGPRESPRRSATFSTLGQVTCDFRLAPFSGQQRRQPIQDASEKYLGSVVMQALSTAVQLGQYPKTQIDVYIIVLQNGGSVLSSSINAASLALCSAGIEMRDFPCAATVSVCRDNLLLVDPTHTEEYPAHCMYSSLQGAVCGTLTLCYLPTADVVSAVHHEGALEGEEAKGAVKLALEAALRVREAARHCLQARVSDSNAIQ